MCSSARWRPGATSAGWRSPRPEAVRILDAAGYDLVIVETVGVGQAEVDVAAATDTALVVVGARAGRRGADRQGRHPRGRRRLRREQGRSRRAPEVVRDLRQMLHLGAARAWDPPVSRRPPRPTRAGSMSSGTRSSDTGRGWSTSGGARRRSGSARLVREVGVARGGRGSEVDRSPARWPTTATSTERAACTGGSTPYGAARARLSRRGRPARGAGVDGEPDRHRRPTPRVPGDAARSGVRRRAAGNADARCRARIPFTRGVYASMYRGRLWTMRQFAGYGTPAETNARLPLPARARADGAVGGVRHADADGARLRRPAQRGRGRPLRRRVATRSTTSRRSSPASRSATSRSR